MATIDEANIATTILCLKTAAEGRGLLPTRVDLALPGPARDAAWVQLARDYLEKNERRKAEKEALCVTASGGVVGASSA